MAVKETPKGIVAMEGSITRKILQENQRLFEESEKADSKKRRSTKTSKEHSGLPHHK